MHCVRGRGWVHCEGEGCIVRGREWVHCEGEGMGALCEGEGCIV